MSFKLFSAKTIPYFKQKDDRKGKCLTMVSTNSTAHIDAARDSFATAIEQTMLVLAEDESLERDAILQTKELLATAIQLVTPTVKYIDQPFDDVVVRTVVRALGSQGRKFPGRGAFVTTITPGVIPWGGQAFYLMRDGRFFVVRGDETHWPYHLDEIFSEMDSSGREHRDADNFVRFATDLVVGLEHVYDQALEKIDERRQNLSGLRDQLQAASAALTDR